MSADQSRKPPKRIRKYLRFSTIGLEMGLAVLLGLYFGQMLDKWLKTEPWLMMLFLFFGVAAAFRNLYRLLREVQADQKLQSENSNSSQQ